MDVAAEIAIVGAGPAGLAAAEAAIGEGCRVAVIDDQNTPGGQFFRRPSTLLGQSGRDLFGSKPDVAKRLLAVLESPMVDYRPATTVWNLPDVGVLAVADHNTSSRLQADAVIVAAGAHDRCVPFPGWTLPGVITAGGALNLVKGQRTLPGRRSAVVGNGPLLLVVAATLLRAGGQLAAVAEAASVAPRVPGLLIELIRVPELLILAARYRARLLFAGVPMLGGYSIVEARGDRKVEEVVLAPITTDGVVDASRSRTFAVDSLVVGFGLQCSSELARLAGCEVAYRPLSGGWTASRGPWLESSVAGLFLAGDGAAIGGAETALAEGALAGLGAARRLRGALSQAGARRAESLNGRLGRLARFRVALERVYEPPVSFSQLLRRDTVICRCEDVTAGQVEDLSRDSAISLVDIKVRTRAGMGRCQGRNCLAGIAEMVATRSTGSAGELVWPEPRPPARPVSISALLAEPIAPPILPVDPHLPRLR